MSKINKIKVENTTYDIQDNTSGFITKDVNDLTNYELKTATGNSIEMSIDSSTYVMTLSLKNSQGTILNTQTVDLPLETMVVGGTYDSTNKKIVLTLKNGNTIDVPVGDLINGLQSEITSTNKLDASLVDDSLSNNKFVTTSEKTTWNNKADTSDVPTKTSDLVNDSDFTAQEVYFNEITTNASSVFVFENKKRGIYYLDSNYDITQFRYKKYNSDSQYLLLSTHPIYLEVYKDFEFDNFEENEYFALLVGQSIYGIMKYKFKKQNNNIVTTSPVGIIEGNFVLSTAQTFGGVKTFNAIPQQSNTTAPTLDTEFTNKKYVDDSIASAITTTLNGSY